MFVAVFNMIILHMYVIVCKIVIYYLSSDLVIRTSDLLCGSFSSVIQSCSSEVKTGLFFSSSLNVSIFGPFMITNKTLSHNIRNNENWKSQIYKYKRYISIKIKILTDEQEFKP